MMYHAVQSLKIETGFFQTKLWQKVYILPESRDNLKKKSPNYIKIDMSTSCNDIKFMFSKKATKIDEIFTINLTFTKYISSNRQWRFHHFLWNTNFNWPLVGLKNRLSKVQLYILPKSIYNFHYGNGVPTMFDS